MEKKKKMNNIYAFIFIILSALLILGVEGCPKSQETQYNGLVVSFVENAPPSTIISDQKFPIYVDIENKGDAYIQQGNAKFYLEGVGDNLKDVKTKLTNKKFLEKGITERLSFSSEASTTLSLKNEYSFPLTLVSCYRYGTLTEAKVCVASANSDVCQISGEKIDSKSNSAAPIQITSLTEEIVGNKIVVSFIVENKGVTTSIVGQPYLKDANCDILEQKSHKDYINELLKEDKVSMKVEAEDFVCSPSDYVSLKTAGKAKVTCEKKLGSDEYQTLFKIVLDYIYKDAITSTVKILPA